MIGAGMAGLTAASELRALGHRPIVLEAQNRVGGRVHTLRDFAPGLYAEAGAMRIPRSHDLTIGLCEKYGLELRPFITGNQRGLVHVGGQRLTVEEATHRPDLLSFQLADHERGRTADQLWEEAVRDIRDLLTLQGPTAWEAISAEYDQYSLHEFFVLRGWSPGAIEMYSVLNFLESDLHMSCVEVLREDLGGYYGDMVEIVGGMDRLPQAMYRELQSDIRLGAEVFAIEQEDRGVVVRYKTEAGRFGVRGAYVLCTLPFPVLRSVAAEPAWSRPKQKAIRQLNYAASTKVLLQVRRRVWEDDDGIFGGATVTDLPIRRMNYPTPDPDNERGVLLASYTWSQDALQWGAMDPETRLEEALEDVGRIHPGVRDVFEVGASYAWYSDRYARGAFALFAPGQLSELHADVMSPEGRVHFAGEHCSLFHAWIQGAVESGLREARAIDAREAGGSESERAG